MKTTKFILIYSNLLIISVNNKFSNDDLNLFFLFWFYWRPVDFMPHDFRNPVQFVNFKVRKREVIR